MSKIERCCLPLLVLLCMPTSVRAEPLKLPKYLPQLVLISGHAGDAATTLRFLHTGSCVESNTGLGPHPSATKEIAAKLKAVGPALGMLWLADHVKVKPEHEPRKRIVKRLLQGATYFSGGLGWYATIHNLHHCGW